MPRNRDASARAAAWRVVSTCFPLGSQCKVYARCCRRARHWIGGIRPAVPDQRVEIGKPEVGIVYQLPFNKSAYAEEKKAEKQLWLNHYGWTDKAKGTVHTPIDVAIQKYISQAGAGK